MLTEASRIQDFPALSGVTYLNTAAEGIPPRAVAQALQQYADDKQLGMDGRLRHEAEWNALRRSAGQAFGLSDDEIGICSCTSEAFNLAAAALRPIEADEVIVNDLDFPAGVTPWLPPNSAATIRLWRSRDGALHVDDLKPLLSSRTRVVSTSLISFNNGFRVPLVELTAVTRALSPALILVDVTQALGRAVLDLPEVDLIISSTHKWILGVHGGCLVGVPRRRSQQWTVPCGGWFNLENAFSSDRFDRVTHKPGAASFSVGMPNYPAVYANRAALDYIQTIGISAIEAASTPLVRECIAGLVSLGVELLTPNDPLLQAGIIAFRHPSAERIWRVLHSQNIHIMHQAGRLRVALHGYNTAADVERFLAATHGALRHE